VKKTLTQNSWFQVNRAKGWAETSNLLLHLDILNTLKIPRESKWLERFQSAITALKTHTLVPRFNPLWILRLGLREGQSVCATTTHEHTWFEEHNCRGCGDRHTWLADKEYGRNWTIASMCAVWRRVHTANICRHIS